MERVAVVMESVRHRPALYWGVASAAALCSLYGTFALAKRTSNNNRVRNGGRLNAGVAFKRLRRRYAEKLRPLLEDLVYLTMFIINLLVGVFYWIMDFCLEPLASSPQKALLRPRRGEIKRLQTRWAWARAPSKPRQRCDCWGYNVEDLVLDAQVAEDDPHVDLQPRLKHEILTESGDTPIAEIGDPSSQALQDERGNIIQPRWSECHCSQCAPLLMPMREAAEKLHVFSPESFREMQEKLLSTSSPVVPQSTPKPSSDDVSQKKERTAIIFIHGMFSSATFWFDTDIAFQLSEDVQKQHRILAPDLLGCGRSPRPVDSLYSLTDQIEAIEKSVIQRYELTSFHLVGHSMGCILALALAARCPPRVRSISLIAPVYPPCGLRDDGELAQIPCDAFYSFLDPLTLKGVRALTVCKYYNISRLIGHLFYAKHTFWVDRVHGFLKGLGYPRSFIHDYLTNYHDAAWHIAHNSLLAGTHAVIPALKKLRDSGHQVLVIHGEIDTSIRFRLAEEMSRTFANVELVGVPDKGHVDVVWGRARENDLLIENAIRAGDERWSSSHAARVVL